MKIPVATKKTQGHRDNDFSFVREGELVYPSWTCTTGTADDHCGCRRCLTGMKSGKGTTTVLVIDSPLSREAYEAAILGAYLRALDMPNDAPSEALKREASECAEFMLGRVARYSVGDVLEYRSGRFSVREGAS